MWMISYITQSVYGNITQTTISEMPPLEFTLVMNHKQIHYGIEDNEHSITDVNSVHVVNAYKLSEDDLKTLNEYIERST